LAGFGGAAVEAGEFEVPAEDVGDAGEDLGLREDDVEERVFVDEVGEAVGAGFLVNFFAGFIAFGVEDFGVLLIDGGDLGRGEDGGEMEEAVEVEGLFLFKREGGLVNVEGDQGLEDIHERLRYF
jgi:hypothetical protein